MNSKYTICTPVFDCLGPGNGAGAPIQRCVAGSPTRQPLLHREGDQQRYQELQPAARLN